MRQEIELYLGGRGVEFNEPPEILFSYIRTDYTDPTVLRNSYSKTLTIEGTPNNNQIFNSIYHLDQIIDPNTFNPAKRMGFQLFSNGDILEQGYAKLDKINKKGKNISYDITLYGGLGEFLYNLSYDQTAEGSDTSRGGGEDRRLSSLVFYNETEPNKEFDFEITKETVAEAWDALEKGTGATMWKYINFAPAYNGYPDNFDADKVLINTQATSIPITYNNNGTTSAVTGFPTVIPQGDNTYRAYNNYAMGELPKEMTEWEMRDLRSYLQRPVLSIKGFFDAIANPINNGGYDVDLDQNFFNDNNPYYAKAWITLPMLKKEETETGQSAKTEVANNVLSISSQLGDSYDSRYYLSGLTPGAVYSGVSVTFSFKTTVAGMPNEVLTTAVDYNAGGIFARDAAYYSCIFVQLVGEDENGNPLAASPIYNFTSPYGKQKGWKFIFGNEWEGGQTEWFKPTDFEDYDPVLVSKRNYKDCIGGFKKISGNNYTWYNKYGNQSAFTVELTDKLEYARVYFRVTKCFKWRDMSNGDNPSFNRFEKALFNDFKGTEEQRRNILVGYVDGGAGGYGITAKTGTTVSQLVGSQVKYTVTSDVVRSGSHISKGDLLNFDGTPCDYLLSYCKLFNLYISKDIYENTIHIRTRDSFYNGGTIDLDKFIDRSKDIKVTPLAMDSRWYDFAYPEDDKCGAAEDYDNNYGVEYGKNKVQTSFEFDSAAINLFDKNIYQNGVQVQESSKYYTLRTVGSKTIPTFLYNTIDYKLFKTPSDASNDIAILPPSGYTQRGYTSTNGKEDWLPKLQLNNNNDPLDGTNILCFYTGSKASPYISGQQVIYYLTDDVAEMYVLNGETPCWIWTLGEYNGSTKIAKGMTKLPIFSRMIYDYVKGQQTIQYTWDFGRVRDTYVPVKTYTDKSTIYERWWSKYIADLYDPNTRVAEVYVKMEGKVVGDWLRSMYWWDNTYWVLTEINDYNITSYATTRCKFVRVNDITNYTSGIQPPQPGVPTATLVPEKYMIDQSGETITAYVKTSDGGAWHIEYPSYVHPSKVAGTGDTTITLRFDANPNADGRDFDIRAYRTVGTPTHFWQYGTESTAQGLSLGATYLIYPYNVTQQKTITGTYRNRGSNVLTVTSNADWVTVGTVAYDGDIVSIPLTVANYINEGAETANTRSAIVTVSGGNGTATQIKIDQVPNTISINRDGGNHSLTFQEIPSVNVQNGFWATYTTNGNDVIFNAPSNLAVQSRSELVHFYAQGQSVASSGYTTIVQGGGGTDLKVQPDVVYYDYPGGGKYITVTCTNAWAVTSKPDWITLSSMDGPSGSSMLLCTAAESQEPYTRTGEIIFSDGRGTASLTAQQLSDSSIRVLSATPQTISASSNAQTFDIDVIYGNRAGDFVSIVPSSNTWYSASTIAWTGDTGRFTIYIGENGSVDARNVTITLSALTGEVSTTIEVSQEGETPYIQMPDNMVFESTGGTKTGTVKSNITWDIDINDTQ